MPKKRDNKMQQESTENKPKRSVGQPTKYKPEYCEMLIEHMKQGFSYDTFCAVIDVHVDTLYNWEKLYPEYSDAKRKAVMMSRYSWEKMGIAGMTGKIPGFRDATWKFNMQNRFKWSDNSEIKQTIEVKELESLSDKELLDITNKALEVEFKNVSNELETETFDEPE